MIKDMTIDELVQNFSLFDDWEERYRYLIDVGRGLPHLDSSLRADDNMVRGCTSQVWMISEIDDSDRFNFQADSDAHIVRGLVALLLCAYNGKTAQEIGAVDIEKIFADIGLDQHLSANRRSGFFAMVNKIKALAVAE